jgi:hypothetical protein
MINQKLLDREERGLPKDEHISHFIHPSRVARIQNSDSRDISSEDYSGSTSETSIHNEVIKNCKLFLEQSKKERKAIGRTTRQSSRIIKNKAQAIKTFGTQTQGINGSELRRKKTAGECQRCAWPRDRKGIHTTLD